MRTRFQKCLSFAAILITATNLFSREYPRFSEKVLHLEGQVLDVFLEDLNGDTATDILGGSAGFGIHVIWDHWVLLAEYGNHRKGWGFINLRTGIKF